MALNIGEILQDRYRIISLLGQGGMGAVYRAEDTRLDVSIALKEMTPMPYLDAQARDKLRQQFHQEANILARLDHPHLVNVTDFFEQADNVYLVMKFIDGKNLSDHINQEGMLADDQVLAWADQLLDALAYCHSQQVIHRDIKPLNVIIRSNGQAVLVDFGLVKLWDPDNPRTQTAVQRTGTPPYAPPEQYEPLDGHTDPRSDLYSLGATLYQTLTGQLPPTIIKRMTTPDQCMSLRDLNPQVSDSTEAVVLKAMALSPDERFQSADEMRASLSGKVPTPALSKRSTLFICYKRNADPDQKLAHYLHDFLTAQGHDVFLDTTLRTGKVWLEGIDQQIKSSDFLIALLSKESADSEMVQAEISRAYEYRKKQGKPHTLPVRIAYEGLLPYSSAFFLSPFQYVVWQNEADNEQVGQEILAAIADQLPERDPIQLTPTSSELVLSEDGRVVQDTRTLQPPLPKFDPRVLESLTAPGGAVKLRDKFYVVRDADARLKREINKAGTTTTIRAPRQTGKSSLLVRGIHHARQNGAKAVSLDLQRVDSDFLASPDVFLRYLADFIVRKLRLDGAAVENAWRVHSSLGPQDRLTYLMEDYVLPESDASIILALDEVDRLLQTTWHDDFFALLRAWHNSRALDEQWDKLNIVMVISTEPYLLISDVNQSPFNVGLRLYLKDFDETRVRGLNEQHGAPVQESDFAQLMELLGGHPYLTRKALYVLVAERLAWADLVRVAATDYGPFSDHLRRHHWLLRDEPDLREALKHIIHHDRCSDDLAFLRLLRAGLVKGSGDVCTCRCDLYRIYFEDKL
ncbi:MAG: protein kinase [Chloroflexi bacterium]|nr:protein kinase [Chloroflexota bacterium]